MLFWHTTIFEFVKSTVNVLFLLNNTYMPYYKWSFRTLRGLGLKHKKIAEELEFLISSDNSTDTANKKSQIVEDVCYEITKDLNNQALSQSPSFEMEQQAYIVNNTIKDNDIRNMHILSGI